MIETRDVDRPLHEDVRRLASTLGRVVRRLEGEAAYQAVEGLRLACRARRREEPGAAALPELLDRVRDLEDDCLAVVTRAFTLFFLLINTAEQVHRVRRRRAYRAADTSPQPASAAWALQRLRDAGMDADSVRGALARLAVRPVLTAHPTEATRRTVLDLQSRVAELLLQREEASSAEAHDHALEAEVELLWLTSAVRKDRPTVLDEVAGALWYLEDRLVAAAEAVGDSLSRAYSRTFGEPLDVPLAPITFGTWVGGDRDGNPYVTPKVSEAAVRRGAYVTVRLLRRQVQRLATAIAPSARFAPPSDTLLASLERDRARLPEVWAANATRDADEPIRLKLSFIAARLQATGRAIRRADQGQPGDDPAAYPRAEVLLADLAQVEAELIQAGAQRVRSVYLQPLIARVRAHGLHGMRMDFREDAAEHRHTLEAICEAIEVPAMDRTTMHHELLGKRPLVAPDLALDEDTQRVLDTFHALRRLQDAHGPRAVDTYIASMAGSVDDMLHILLLAREAGLVDLASEPAMSRIDVVPLFETLADLEAAPRVLRELARDPVYARQLAARGGRQEVMLGYSDSAKDAGLLPASWALYRAQEGLAATAREQDLALTLFHGRGGTVGRGGGSPVYRGLSALPAGTCDGALKMTEQGEVISQKFGLPDIAERSLEVMLTGALAAATEDWKERLAPGEEECFRGLMDRMAATALPVFRGLVHEDNALYQLFVQATPVRELAHVHFGSRPAYREHGAGTMAGIRAIPWVFGWTQTRLLLPGWLGVGEALRSVLDEPGGAAQLRRMAAAWPFFDDLLSKVEMVCAKADLPIARQYIEGLGADRTLFDKLEQAFHGAVAAVLEVRQTPHLLERNAVLRAAIALRNPYVDPLNLAQVALLQRKRDGEEGLDALLGTALNGVAQGLRNTG